MSHHAFGARHVLTALTGLDFGLRVGVQVRPAQRTIFSGAEKVSVQALTSEVAELVAGLRVYSYAVRGQLEQIVSALQFNVESGSWSYARRAALDLATVLSVARNRRSLMPRGPGAAPTRVAHRGSVRSGGALMAFNLTPTVPVEPLGPAGPSSPVTAASAAVAVSAPSVPAEAAAIPMAIPTDAELDSVQLDASKLHCYQVALELHTQCSVLVAVLHRAVRDQLERASLSVLLNTAEAGGRRSRKDKARHFAYAPRRGGVAVTRRAGRPLAQQLLVAWRGLRRRSERCHPASGSGTGALTPRSRMPHVS